MFKSTPLAHDARLFILLLGMLAAISALAVDMYLPSLPAIAQDMGVAIGRVQLTLSVFLLGFGCSQLVCGPLSDRLGRKPIIVFGLLLFSLASLLCALSQSVEQLIAWRFLQALGGGAASVVVIAVVRDLYQGARAARLMSLVFMSMAMAPLLAPLVGGQLLLWFGWRSVFVVLCLLAVFLVGWVWLRMPETHLPANRQAFSPTSLVRSYRSVLSHRQAVGNLLCCSFAFAGMFAFITASPYVYIQYFGVPAHYFGLLFGANILVMMLLNWINSRWVTVAGLESIVRGATRLQMLAGFVLLVAVISGFGGLWGVFLPLVIFVGMLGLIGANTTTGTLAAFGRSAGSASALLGAVRYLFGAGVAALVAWTHDGTALPMAAIVCGCGLLSFVSYRLLVPAGDSAAGRVGGRLSVIR